MMNSINLHRLSWLSLTLLLFLVLSTNCKEKKDVSGEIVGNWKTEWDDILDGDLDEITVEEILILRDENEAGSKGRFVQVFSGSVKYDDWENETEIPYVVEAEGSWRVEKKDQVILNYDIDETTIKIGESTIEADYSDLGIGLLTGDLGSFIEGALQVGQVKELNRKVEDLVKKGVSSFFRSMFIEMNKEKKSLTSVVIYGNTMNCEVNHGFWGRDQNYYRIKPTSNNTTHPSTTNTINNSETAHHVVNGAVITKSGKRYPFQIEYDQSGNTIRNAKYVNSAYSTTTPFTVAKLTQNDYYFEGKLGSDILTLRYSAIPPYEGQLVQGEKELLVRMDL